jgi:hypothetical protein
MTGAAPPPGPARRSPRTPGAVADALGPPGSPRRLLAGALVALVVMIAGSLVVQMAGAQLNREFISPFGPVPLADVVSVLLAMTAGGAVARSRAFRWVAVVLQALVWAAIIAMLYLAHDGSPVSSLPLSMMLQHNAAALALSLIAAGLGAWLGERLAMPHRAGQSG